MSFARTCMSVHPVQPAQLHAWGPTLRDQCNAMQSRKRPVSPHSPASRATWETPFSFGRQDDRQALGGDAKTQAFRRLLQADNVITNQVVQRWGEPVAGGSWPSTCRSIDGAVNARQRTPQRRRGRDLMERRDRDG
jgi:hypothetical protein